MLKIGFGEGIITPHGRVSLRGQYNIRVSEKPREDIKAVGLVFTNGRENVFWAACDLVSVSQSLIDEVFVLLADQVPVTKDSLILSATHIHTGPYLDDEISGLNGNHMIPPDTTSADDCRHAVARGVAAALKDAWGALEEAYVESTVARIRTGVSRRSHYTDGSTVMYGKVARPDYLRPESRDGGPVQLAYVRRRADDSLMGVIADVPCTAQVVESKYYITPDYFGVVRSETKRRLGVPVFGIVGAAGDTSPHILLGVYPGEPARGEEEHREALGRRIADAIEDHAGDHLRFFDGADFTHACKKVTLPVWQSTKEERDESEAWLNELRKQYGDDLNYEKMRAAGFRDNLRFSKALANVARYREEQAYFDIDIHAVRIGKMAFITNPFELYIEYADRMRAALRGVQLFDSELTGECPGYLATERGVRGGGYSATIFSGQTSPAGGEILVKESIDLLRSLF